MLQYNIIFCWVLLWGATLAAVPGMTGAGAGAKGAAECGPCDCYVDKVATKTLNCTRRNLKQVPRDWPNGLDFLETGRKVLINFYNNSIGNVSGLPALRSPKVAVSFKYNRLTVIDDDAFENITNIFYLDLSNNLLNGQSLRSETFRGPYSEGVYATIALETLNVAHNQIHSLDRRLFEYTPNLKRLYLNDNPFEILDHVTMLAISSASQLEVLDLSYTELESVPADTFRGLERLQQLYLSGNRLSSVPESLAILGASLQYLIFNNNSITQLNDDSFVGLANLKELEVSDNALLEEVRRGAFSPLRRLKVLRLCHNAQLRYVSHNAFRDLRDGWTLEEVYLDHNDLSELPTDLLPWSRLQVLSLAGNDWLCNCDLADIITRQGAGTKFQPDDIPTCIAPMRLSGTYITKIPLDYCPDYPGTLKRSHGGLSLGGLKPRHIVWSIFGVAMVVLIGMILGLLVNFTKGLIHRKTSQETIRYVHINTNTMI